jgi:hypothetical protein
MSTVCRKASKKVNTVNEGQSSDEGSSGTGNDEEVSQISQLVIKNMSSNVMSCQNVECISNIQSVHAPVIRQVFINSTPCDMELDTGASVSVMSDKLFLAKFPDTKWEQCKVKLKTVAGNELNVLGQAYVNVSTDNRYPSVKLPLVIIGSELVCQPLLGRTWIDKLYPEWRTVFSTVALDDEVVKADKLAVQLKKDFKGVMQSDRSSTIKNLHANLVLKDNITPIFHQAYHASIFHKRGGRNRIKVYARSWNIETSQIFRMGKSDCYCSKEVFETSQNMCRLQGHN